MAAALVLQAVVEVELVQAEGFRVVCLEWKRDSQVTRQFELNKQEEMTRLIEDSCTYDLWLPCDETILIQRRKNAATHNALSFALHNS